MRNDVYVRALRRAADIMGGMHQLRACLCVSIHELQAWMQGAEKPPTDIFLKAVDIVSAPIGTDHSELMRRSREVRKAAAKSASAAQALRERAAESIKRAEAAQQRSLTMRAALLDGGIAGVMGRPMMSAADFAAKQFTVSEGTLVLESALNAAVNGTAATRGNIQLVHQDGLRIVAHIGFEQPFLEFFATVRHESAASCGCAYESGLRTVVTDVATDPIFVGTHACDVMHDAKAVACQSTPLIGDSGEIIGMLNTHYDKPHQPSARELATLDLICQRASFWLAGYALAG